jgi:hypothetical protein
MIPAPAACALRENSIIRAALPEKSPTVELICPRATFTKVSVKAETEWSQAEVDTEGAKELNAISTFMVVELFPENGLQLHN